MTAQPVRMMTPVLIGGAVALFFSMGIRQTFGLFQIPIGEEFGWPRSAFSLAIAIQNLAWGVGQPIFGMIAERFGDRKALVLGVFCYAAGLLLSAASATPLAIQSWEVLMGFGMSGLGYGVILAMVGRAAAPESRSMAMAIASAAGSGGQVVMPPLAAGLLNVLPWQAVFVVFAGVCVALLAILPLMRVPPATGPMEPERSLGEVLGFAFRDPSYTLIFVGFFACGYQVAFISAHFPAFVTEACGPIAQGGLLAAIGVGTTSALGAVALAVMGFVNVLSTLAAGWAARHWPRKYLLSSIYLGRTIVLAAFVMTPMTPGTVLLFSVTMGALWLPTVPLTSALIAHIWGLRYMGTLFGIVFLSHQIGSFAGVWLGGQLYDLYGSYTLVWWIGAGIGLFSALVHLPVRERPTAMAA